MKFKKYTLEQFTDSVINNYSIASALKQLGINPNGGNYITFHKIIQNYNININHFTGKGHLKNKNHSYKLRNIDDILVYGNYESTHAIRLRLLKEGIKSHQCEYCKLTHWLLKPIPLELHHVDGDRKNNTLQNLQLLCPNCHSLTHNHRGKNKKSSDKPIVNKPIVNKKFYYCVDCKNTITPKTKRCRNCADKFLHLTKINWPSTQELINLINNSSYCATGKLLGVSDNAIRKRLKFHHEDKNLNFL